jgi:hypothetical protein
MMKRAGKNIIPLAMMKKPPDGTLLGCYYDEMA